MDEGSITLILLADLKDIERMNRVVRQFGELHEVPGRTLYAVNLALDEVMTNIVLHGYKGRATAGEQILLRLEIVGQMLRCEVRDGGLEFNPLNAPIPDLTLPLEERTLGGLGIHLVRSLMDHVEYRREGQKNVLTMQKRIR